MKDSNNNNETNLKTFILKSLIISLIGGFMYIFIKNISSIKLFIDKMIIVLLPFIYGIILAYLKYPLFNKLNNSFKNINKKHDYKVISIIMTELLVLLSLTAIFISIVPKFIQSAIDIVNSIPTIVNSIHTEFENLASINPELYNYITNLTSNSEFSLNDSVQKQLFTVASTYITKLTYILKDTGTLILNLLLGLVISILLIFHKERIFSNIDKIVKLLLNDKAYNLVKEETKVIHTMLSGFFIGKIVDSLIIGIICFIVCKILNMPYALVVSVIVGVTNIIPIFGPFIGAIPSVLIVLSIDPVKALELTIFIFVLQQFDGNILGPKLLGNSTGLDTLWIIFAITLFGGLFGIVGMILGVPIVAVLKDIETKVVNYYIDVKKHSK